MRKMRVLVLWFLLLVLTAITVYFALETLGYLPHQAPQLDKVLDLKHDKKELSAAQKRRELIVLKTRLEKKIVGYPGSTEKKNNARRAMYSGIKLFAKKKYDRAKEKFELGFECFRRKVALAELVDEKRLKEVKAAKKASSKDGRKEKKASKTTIASLDKELEALEKRLAGITDPGIETDEAWLMLNRAFNSIRDGKVRDAKYFLDECNVIIRNLENY